jgi:putative transposase
MQRPDGKVRKRMHRWESGPPVRYLTFSCYRRLPLLDSERAKDLLAASLARARERYQFRLVAWVVMPEHVHLIIVPGGGVGSVAAILRSLKQPVAQTLLRAWRRSEEPILSETTTAAGERRVWQEGGGFDRNIRSAEELEREIAYIHFNPVKRGLAPTPTHWKWSSARWYARQQNAEPAGSPWGDLIEIDRTGVDWGVKAYT